MRQTTSLKVLTGILVPWTAIRNIAAFQTKFPLSSHYPYDHTSWKRRHSRSPPASWMTPRQRIVKTALNDLSEWRDLYFDETQKPSIVNDVMEQQNVEGPAREVCIFPFALNDILIQGETKELCLYEERFHNLFENAQNSHAGVVAMGLIAPPAGILQVMPLCEIESFRTMPGQTEFGTAFSILVTIRVVGRASLIQVLEEDLSENIDYLRGWCVEVNDEVKGSSATDAGTRTMTLGNEFADRLEDVMDSLVTLEAQLASMGGSTDGGGEEFSVAVLKRRLLEAELDVTRDDDDDDEEEEEDDDDEVDNRRSRFEQAYKVAKSSDMQGYRTTFPSTEPAESNSRSIQDLTALSWAYFSTEENPEVDYVHRLQAVECEDLCLRLKLALTMLMERRSNLKEIMKGMVSEEYGEEEEEE
mmetsp:Transcript_8781/g.10257  ORF Transcript_8781/g.10257 Transcript_8781/m.10257 type:complete len:416 (-) Transcript_8781:482-1729(-)|eukprot:CAMPEP_0198263354 /NCGR_PEP_ID=MMETSP1447-20131203/11701_1 /TAXON_ID=420782 /ORGANISM="Chaetoceros dichaeta, Strain CCMP1751" /LENGTH=415 /DNA_ID=CAMNT_0043951907 /DNA_START=77 /DNA_END=1324 /DNA_ORIENTATION=-